MCEPIPPSEFMEWTRASGNIVRPAEYAILCGMDAVFCSETTKEVVAYNQREEERRRIAAGK